MQVEQGAIQIQFLCPVCPYKHSITQKHKVQVTTVRKKMDDVMGGNKAWENVDKTAHVCPACNHNEAYFMQMQVGAPASKASPPPSPSPLLSPSPSPWRPSPNSTTTRSPQIRSADEPMSVFYKVRSCHLVISSSRSQEAHTAYAAARRPATTHHPPPNAPHHSTPPHRPPTTHQCCKCGHRDTER